MLTPNSAPQQSTTGLNVMCRNACWPTPANCERAHCGHAAQRF